MIPNDILKKYNILQLLHHGVGGDVWLAEHIGLTGKRVLKTIEKTHPQYLTLVQEAKLLQQCRHASIPIIYDILEFDTQTYIVEEYIEGENLKQYILKMRSLSNSLLLDFSIQLCEILQFLHNPARPILYLDLKPDNILVMNHRLKLIDFGSAIYRNRQNGTRYLFGTPGYCAPEMKRAETLSERTDIYSLGKCMEYMIMFTEKLPRGYQKITDRCLRKETRDYQSVSEIRQDLEKIGKRRRQETAKECWFAVTGILSEQESVNTALQLAIYLRYRYKKTVLYLDCSKERWIERLEKSGRKEEKGQGFVFEKNGITIAKRVAPQELHSWRGRGYSYVVCDFGKSNPMISEIPFRLCLCTGVVTEMTLPEWEARVLLISKRYRVSAALCGGDEELAMASFGKICRVGRITPFFSVDTKLKESGRQMRRLIG